MDGCERDYDGSDERFPIRQPSDKLPINKTRDPRLKRFKVPKPVNVDEHWMKVLGGNSALMSEGVTWSKALLADLQIENVLSDEEVKNVNMRRGKGVKGKKVIEYLKKKTSEEFGRFLGLLSRHGYEYINSKLCRDLADFNPSDDELDDQVEELVREQEKQKLGDPVQTEDIIEESDEMQKFLKGLIKTAQDYVNSKIDIGPKVEMTTCANIIRSTFDQMAQKIKSLEASQTQANQENKDFRDMCSKREAQLEECKKQLSETQTKLEQLKSHANTERAKVIEDLKEQLREKEVEITKINAKLEKMKSQQNIIIEEHDQKLLSVKKEYSSKISKMSKNQEDQDRRILETTLENKHLKAELTEQGHRLENLERKMERKSANDRSERITLVPIATTSSGQSRNRKPYIDYSSGPYYRVTNSPRPNNKK